MGNGGSSGSLTLSDSGRWPQDFISAAELAQSVAEGLLTKDEARQVYWSQFPALRHQAAVTAPPIAA